MNNKYQLSVVSRILIAFASGALITVFFLPAWRIDLFAPQYPEGLKMNIWINGLSGQVDIINGLNHYIGMKKISENMFPEFNYLPYVVGFYMLLGMMVSITGKRKLLMAYLVLTLIGGSLALYDFYKWGYEYGHHLDPNAPIQVKGLYYQPPLFGHKRLLNFDAYSFPDVGGWVVIAAAALAFSVWFFEWYKNRKTGKNDNLNLPAMALVVMALMMGSCKVKPEAFIYGKDNCYTCKMGIIDEKYGGETLTKKGKVFKFDDVLCMVRYLKSGALNEEDIRQNLLIDFEKGKEFMAAPTAFILVGNNFKSPMGSHAAAFSSPESAAKFKSDPGSELLTWKEVYERIQ
jgi:copper chaperone NosL